MALCGIYKYTNKINNKSYIGQSKDINKRYKEHLNNKASKNFDQILQKEGIENFTFEILELCKEEDLNKKENEYILKYDSINNGYNIKNAPSVNYVSFLKTKKHYEQNQKQIKYKINIMEELKRKGYNSSAIRELNLFSQSTLTKFRNGQEVSLENIGRLCFLLDCNIGDILEYA